MHFIDYIYFIGTVGRHVLNVSPQFPHLIHAVIGCSVNFKHIHRIAAGDLPA